jgi:hypothetical protein
MTAFSQAYIVELLATSLPSQAPWFMNYIILQSLGKQLSPNLFFFLIFLSSEWTSSFFAIVGLCAVQNQVFSVGLLFLH